MHKTIMPLMIPQYSTRFYNFNRIRQAFIRLGIKDKRIILKVKKYSVKMGTGYIQLDQDEAQW
jgi:hypothetical protein